jgi:hypothetical protein
MSLTRPALLALAQTPPSCPAVARKLNAIGDETEKLLDGRA